ncbi:ArsR family transcriptional regulator [Microbacterium marinum]|uniref:arsenate-mycothiol transferase ArsC n=1 Tax=Microbacterium marinum TaxID=421115 RepID=UPI00384BB078
MRANLVAHHLNVLQTVGIIHRSRSEADKRRSYVRLVKGALEGLTPCVFLAARRVVFASTGASARAPLAVALWSKVSSIPATSGGTMPAEAVSVGALAAARRHSVHLLEQTPRALEEVLTDGDIVITVCDRAKEQIAPIGDLHWSISDPGRVGTDASFDAAFDEIHRRVAELAPRVVTS